MVNYSASNPISVLHHGPLKEHQALSYNALLTQLAKVLSNLKDDITIRRNNDIEFYTQAVGCWQGILEDLSDVILPEFYVVFHDRTTNARQKRQLYDITQAIYFAVAMDAKKELPQYLSEATKPNYTKTKANVFKKLLKSHPIKTYDSVTNKSEIDSYMTGKGQNASVAYELKDMAHFVEINGSSYLNSFNDYYNLIISKNDLLNCLISYDVATISRQLDSWSKQRLLAFSIVDIHTVTQTPLLKRASKRHVLTTWVLQDYLSSNQYSSTQSTKYIDSQQLNIYLELAKNERVSPSLKNNRPKSKHLGRFWYRVKTLFVADITPPMKKHDTLTSQRVDNSNRLPSLFSSPSRFAHQRPAHQLTKAESPDTSNEPIKSDNIDFDPITIKRHAYHLSILLTATPTSKLKKLINATNVLCSHLDYLNQAHPYLATSVEEFIKDLTYNTIVRLDETASQFVKGGKVNANVRNTFKQQHEARIEQLIELNLEQVKDINKTILDKKMAGFSDVGNQTERRFRETQMELKILLRWLIAQQPDEVQASSHQVILDNLEKSTLADMQSVFFDSQTTCEQRLELQEQLYRLLTHFKQQNTQSIKITSTRNDDADMRELLQLSHKSDRLQMESPTKQGLTAHAHIDTVANQSNNQAFIDFNKHYVSEILDHWH